MSRSSAGAPCLSLFGAAEHDKDCHRDSFWSACDGDWMRGSQSGVGHRVARAHEDPTLTLAGLSYPVPSRDLRLYTATGSLG